MHYDWTEKPRRTEGSPVQISDSSSVGAGEQERHTDREEVQKYFGLKLTPVETIPLPLPPCFRQWPVCADRRDGCRSPGGAVAFCAVPPVLTLFQEAVPAHVQGRISLRRALEQFTWPVRSLVTGLLSPVVLRADPFLVLSGMLSFVAVIGVAWLLHVQRLDIEEKMGRRQIFHECEPAVRVGFFRLL